MKMNIPSFHSGHCPIMDKKHTITIYYVEIPIPRSFTSGKKVVFFNCDHSAFCNLDLECPIFKKGKNSIQKSNV